ncbi:UNVERIFIED_ORG: hypothetical protein ABID57_000706 [Arthrobacter sp. UYEF1]
MAKTYQVRVTNEFRSTTSAPRRSAGLVIDVNGDGYLGELTDEQLAEVQADQYLLVTEPSAAEADATKGRIKKATGAAALKTKNVEVAKAEAKADGEVERKEIVAGTPGPVAKA